MYYFFGSLSSLRVEAAILRNTGRIFASVTLRANFGRFSHVANCFAIVRACCFGIVEQACNFQRLFCGNASVRRGGGVKNLRTTFRRSISRLDGCRVESCYRYSAFREYGSSVVVRVGKMQKCYTGRCVRSRTPLFTEYTLDARLIARNMVLL